MDYSTRCCLNHFKDKEFDFYNLLPRKWKKLSVLDYLNTQYSIIVRFTINTILLP
ncbi:MAG: hypothetical protein BAJALOKI1v1_210019 [Promethearchaeota archaeon]|nr:MAG: hypothetical protein BAJALOKI1v1_210019 [Candidatus Lokiarchaeota archaeon]